MAARTRAALGSTLRGTFLRRCESSGVALSRGVEGGGRRKRSDRETHDPREGWRLPSPWRSSRVADTRWRSRFLTPRRPRVLRSHQGSPTRGRVQRRARRRRAHARPRACTASTATTRGRPHAGLWRCVSEERGSSFRHIPARAARRSRPRAIARRRLRRRDRRAPASTPGARCPPRVRPACARPAPGAAASSSGLAPRGGRDGSASGDLPRWSTRAVPRFGPLWAPPVRAIRRATTFVTPTACEVVGTASGQAATPVTVLCETRP